MATPISSTLTEDRLRESLKQLGYSLSPRRKNGENGADIIATKEGESVYIEVIGYKSTGSARSRDFCEAVFRAISRIKDGARKVVVACPVEFQLGLMERTAILDIAWRRLGAAFPELQLWFVFPDRLHFDRGHWNQWFETYNRKHLIRIGEIVE